jgi:hypothetical protein
MTELKEHEFPAPATFRQLSGELIPTVPASEVHAALHVGRRFQTWIKDRVLDNPFFDEGLITLREIASQIREAKKGAAVTTQSRFTSRSTWRTISA